VKSTHQTASWTAEWIAGVAIAPIHDSFQMFCFTRPTPIQGAIGDDSAFSFVPITSAPMLVSRRVR